LAQIYRDADKEIATIRMTGSTHGSQNDYENSFANNWFETYKRTMKAYADTEAWRGVWEQMSEE